MIDDEPVILKLFVAILTEQDYAVDTAQNGMEGLKMLNNIPYDLIISDIDMPVMKGIEFYSKLLEKMPFMKQKIIFMTGNRDIETEMFIKKNGIGCFFKPFQIPELLNIISERILY